jgi:hypothetical protein
VLSCVFRLQFVTAASFGSYIWKFVCENPEHNPWGTKATSVIALDTYIVYIAGGVTDPWLLGSIYPRSRSRDTLSDRFAVSSGMYQSCDRTDIAKVSFRSNFRAVFCVCGLFHWRFTRMQHGMFCLFCWFKPAVLGYLSSFSEQWHTIVTFYVHWPADCRYFEDVLYIRLWWYTSSVPYSCLSHLFVILITHVLCLFRCGLVPLTFLLSIIWKCINTRVRETTARHTSLCSSVLDKFSNKSLH